MLGTGLLKPNISVIVGQLYTPRDIRRDAGFSIFYMGINLGAFLGPLITGFLAQDPRFRAMIAGWGMDPNSAWHWAFGAAGVGMTLGLVQYVFVGSRARERPAWHPGGATTPALAAKFKRQALLWGGCGHRRARSSSRCWPRRALVTLMPTTVRDLAGYSLIAITVVFFAVLFLDRSWTREERGRLWIIFVFFVCASIFWSVFEQAGSTLNLFADRSTRNELLGFHFPSSWFQALNALFIIALRAALRVAVGHARAAPAGRADKVRVRSHRRRPRVHRPGPGRRQRRAPAAW